MFFPICRLPVCCGEIISTRDTEAPLDDKLTHSKDLQVIHWCRPQIFHLYIKPIYGALTN